MTFSAGKRTTRNLIGVHPQLVEMVHAVFRRTSIDFCMINDGGVRSQKTADANALSGVGVSNSRHLTGHAVDLVPYIDGRPKWDRAACIEISKVVFEVCDELGILIRWGADWDNDGKTEKGEYDFVHYEIPRSNRKALAREAMLRRTRLTELTLEQRVEALELWRESEV